jgi:GrpB-like predicted nucleotidyltransferase (UPF0157 family)
MESFEDKLRRVLGERIDVVDYDESWPSLFDSEGARLAAYFPPGSIRRIEHIGSTAVPGLAAKPIIDILVGVDDYDFVIDEVAPAMEDAGYDYFLRPAFGEDGPRYPWLIGRDSSGRRVSHIHVALMDDAAQWDRVIFRDHLRRHPDIADDYAILKRDLAARFSDDREAYTQAKTAFITHATDAGIREALTRAATATNRGVQR